MSKILFIFDIDDIASKKKLFYLFMIIQIVFLFISINYVILRNYSLFLTLWIFIFVLEISYIMYSEEIDNIFVTSIDKNLRPIDIMVVGHFLMGTIGYLIFSLFINSLNSYIVVCILGIVFEPFEWVLFKYTNFTNLRFQFYRKYYPNFPFSLETEKNKMECFSNIFLDTIFVWLGSLFSFLVFDIFTNILLNIFFVSIYVIVKKKVLDRFLKP